MMMNVGTSQAPGNGPLRLGIAYLNNELIQDAQKFNM